jgi:hypothetical protein
MPQPLAAAVIPTYRAALDSVAGLQGVPLYLSGGVIWAGSQLSVAATHQVLNGESANTFLLWVLVAF